MPTFNFKEIYLETLKILNFIIDCLLYKKAKLMNYSPLNV